MCHDGSNPNYRTRFEELTSSSQLIRRLHMSRRIGSEPSHSICVTNLEQPLDQKPTRVFKDHIQTITLASPYQFRAPRPFKKRRLYDWQSNGLSVHLWLCQPVEAPQENKNWSNINSLSSGSRGLLASFSLGVCRSPWQSGARFRPPAKEKSREGIYSGQFSTPSTSRDIYPYS